MSPLALALIALVAFYVLIVLALLGFRKRKRPERVSREEILAMREDWSWPL